MIDFLTDSGTSAMSANQWAGMMIGDESYAGASSWLKNGSSDKRPNRLSSHTPNSSGQGCRKNSLQSFGGKGKIFISNTHFDTTSANIEFTGAEAFDIPVPEDQLTQYLIIRSKETWILQNLKDLIKKKGAENIGGVILTVTNNSGGGQPVSMQMQ